LYLTHDARRVIQPLPQAVLRAVQNVGVLFQTLAHMAKYLTQLPLNGLDTVIQDLGEMTAQLVDLLLHQQ
jgi:hypothetical protein